MTSHGSDLGILGRQSLARPLTDPEQRLAAALEQVFATGEHQFTEVAQALQRMGVPRPSGEAGPWTVDALEAELRRINESLDEAYLTRHTRRGP